MSFERNNIRRMAGYAYGEQPDDDTVIKLNTNENPYPPSQAVQRSLETFNTQRLRRYPPALASEFRKSAAKLHGVAEQNIIATRGGDELLRLLFTTFTDPGDNVVVTDPTYSLYPVLAQIQDARVVAIPLQSDWSLPSNFADSANGHNPKLTFVVNPHAPSGQLVPENTIRQLAKDIDSILVIDEAYVDFIDPSHAYNCLNLVQDHDNVMFLRSMSKGYGLAGLRFGYGIGHRSLIEPMVTKTRDSYNLDAISQTLATAALEDQEYAKATWQKVRNTRADLRTALQQRGFEVPTSEANFLLATTPTNAPSAKRLFESLKQQNIYVRFFDVDGLNNKLRISIGTDPETEALLDALDRALA